MNAFLTKLLSAFSIKPTRIDLGSGYGLEYLNQFESKLSDSLGRHALVRHMMHRGEVELTYDLRGSLCWSGGAQLNEVDKASIKDLLVKHSRRSGCTVMVLVDDEGK